jgi:hypothetical protein
MVAFKLVCGSGSYRQGSKGMCTPLNDPKGKDLETPTRGLYGN